MVITKKEALRGLLSFGYHFAWPEVCLPCVPDRAAVGELVVDSGKITIELKAPNKPGVLRADGEFTYVIMPVNLQ